MATTTSLNSKLHFDYKSLTGFVKNCLVASSDWGLINLFIYSTSTILKKCIFLTL